MMKLDKDALECDLAETYHIFDIKELPLSRVALFSYGLRNNSRIKMKMSGMNYSLEDQLFAAMLDQLRLLVWTKTEDAQNGLNRPDSILAELLGETKKEKEFMVFNSVEEFEETRNKMLKGE